MTITGFEHATTWFVNRHSTIWPNWPKWLSFRLQTKWFWVRIPLLSLKSPPCITKMEKLGRSDYVHCDYVQLRSLWASYECGRSELMQSRHLLITLKILGNELHGILLILIDKGWKLHNWKCFFMMIILIYFFILVAIVRKKILKILF